MGNYGPKGKKDQPSLVQDKAKTDDAVPVDKKLSNKQRQLTRFLYYLGVGYVGPTASTNIDTEVGATSAGSGNPILSEIHKCQKVTSMLGLWVLPGMYGLLGAVVFQMRAILNPLIPPPLERLLIRFSLGALAGVSITWLFGATTEKLFEAQSLNATLFGVSFLLGFSIDVFFTLLDRTVEMLSDAIAKKGK